MQILWGAWADRGVYVLLFKKLVLVHNLELYLESLQKMYQEAWSVNFRFNSGVVRVSLEIVYLTAGCVVSTCFHFMIFL
jgi:hypothetical protein